MRILLLIVGSVAMFAFAWAARFHFRSRGVAAGMICIALLTIANFVSFLHAMLVLQAPMPAGPLALSLQIFGAALFLWTLLSTTPGQLGLAFDPGPPSSVFREGPYRYIRHPFYASYILFWIGCTAAIPTVLGGILLLLLCVCYVLAARREELAFRVSPYSEAYRRYSEQAGFLWPRALRSCPQNPDEAPTERKPGIIGGSASVLHEPVTCGAVRVTAPVPANKPSESSHVTHAVPTGPGSSAPPDEGLVTIHPLSQTDPDNAYCVRLCSNSLQYDAAYRLRYMAYRAVEAIPKAPSQLFKDPFDTPHSLTHLVEQNGRPIGSIRACASGPGGDYTRLPAGLVYRDELVAECGANSSIIESNRFVVDPDVKGGDLLAHMLLFRMIAINAILADADFIVTAVRERHISFYRRSMLFKVISQPRVYPGLNVPMVLMCGDFKNRRHEAISRTPLFFPSDAEIARYKACLGRHS